MAKSARYVFSACADAHRQITDLFDFIHPTTISMWNLRWQVRGFVDSHPNVGHADIDARFARGINVNSGSIKKVCVDMPWETQLENFSVIILINCIAIFEDFCSQISRLIEENEKKARDIEECFQFPPSHYPPPQKNAFQRLGPTSSVLSGGVNWDAPVLKRYHPSKIEGLLLCYRYFKEIRNSISHNGRRANQRTIDAYQNFRASINAGGMDGINIPEHNPILNKNDRVEISYRGVIGFTEIIILIITYYDISLIDYKIVEKNLRNRLSIDKNTWPTDQKAISRRIKRLIHSAGLPDLIQSENLKKFLRAEAFIPKYVL